MEYRKPWKSYEAQLDLLIPRRLTVTDRPKALEYLQRKGNILIPKKGGAILTDKRRLLVEHASYNSSVMDVKADETIVSDPLLFRFMLSAHLGDYIDTSVIPQNNKHIECMEILPAPFGRQVQIVVLLDVLTENTRTLEAETHDLKEVADAS